MRTPEERAKGQIGMTQLLVEALGDDPPPNAVVVLLRGLSKAGLRLSIDKDSRAADGLKMAEDAMPRDPKASLLAFIKALMALGDVVNIGKIPCEDPDCEACREAEKVIDEVMTELEIDEVTDAISHGHTLDHDCPICAAADDDSVQDELVQDQIDNATELVEQMIISGDIETPEGEDPNVSSLIASLLDNLACANLMLVASAENYAGMAYHLVVAPAPHDDTQ